MDLMDIVILCIVILGGLNGYRLGLIRQVARLFGVVIAYFLAVWLKPYVTPVIASFHIIPKQTGVLELILGDANGAIAFVLVFFLSWLLLRYGVSLLDTLFKLPILSTINRLAGLLVGLLVACLFVYIATLVIPYISSSQLQTQYSNSVVANWMRESHFQDTVNQWVHSHLK